MHKFTHTSVFVARRKLKGTVRMGVFSPLPVVLRKVGEFKNALLNRIAEDLQQPYAKVRSEASAVSERN